MKEFVFATNNKHKIAEISHIIGNKVRLISLGEIGLMEEIPETSATIEGNAMQKARYVFERCHTACFADDTGLEVEALGGAPGVFSARYAGENASYADNVTKLLSTMSGVKNRAARFKTVIAYIDQHQTRLFEGIINGVISENPYGTGGFGYDPVFIPDDYQVSFAEMSAELKNTISHRALATQKLVSFLLSL